MPIKYDFLSRTTFPDLLGRSDKKSQRCIGFRSLISITLKHGRFRSNATIIDGTYDGMHIPRYSTFQLNGVIVGSTVKYIYIYRERETIVYRYFSFDALDKLEKGKK